MRHLDSRNIRICISYLSVSTTHLSAWNAIGTVYSSIVLHTTLAANCTSLIKVTHFIIDYPTLNHLSFLRPVGITE